MNAKPNLFLSARRMLAVLVVLVLSGGLGAAQAEGGADLFQQSYDDEATGKLAEALADIERLPEGRKDTYTAQLRRGWLQYRLGQNAVSVESYKRAAALVPTSVEARVGMLLPLLADRRFGTAEKAARDALKLDPHNYLATLRLAWSLYNLGQYGDALALYRKLTDAYPSDVDVRAGLGWSLVKLGRNTEAAAEFRQVLEIAPKHALAREGAQLVGGLTAK